MKIRAWWMVKKQRTPCRSMACAQALKWERCHRFKGLEVLCDCITAGKGRAS